MAPRVSMAAAAREAGVSRATASKARSKGRLVTDDNGLVDPEHAKAVLGQRRGRPVGPVPTQGGETLAQAQLRKERALADIRQMEAARLRGELLPAEDVQRADEAIWSAVRDRLRSIPMSLAPLIVEAAHKPNAEQGVYKLMLDAIDEALMDIGTAEIITDDDEDQDLDAG